MNIWLSVRYGILEFVIVLVALYIFIRVDGISIWRDDINKPYKRKVLTGAGFPILLVVSVFFGLYAIYYRSYFYVLFGIILTTLIGMLIGFVDEIWDVRVWKKVPLMLLPPVPLVLIALFHPLWPNTCVLWINFGILYWVLVVPVVYMGFSNGANIIAGYDGLEGGVYILILITYILIGVLLSNELVIILSAVLLSAILAFELFNLPPSKLLLGNVGSFPIGGILGIIPLIGHFEIVLPIVFAPHLAEFMFKLKHRGHTSVFGEVDEKGIIHNKDGIKSVLHWIISWGNMTEKKITLAMLGIEALLCAVAFGVWYFIWFL